MGGMTRWVLGLWLLGVAACGGGAGPAAPVDPNAGCPLVGQSLAGLRKLEFESQQVRISVRIVSVDRTHYESLGVPLPNLAVLAAAAPSTLGGTNCGVGTGVSTSVVGGANGAVVFAPNGTQDDQPLPVFQPDPITTNSAGFGFANLPGTQGFSIASGDRRSLTGSPVLPGGQVLAPEDGTPDQALRYVLTDAAGQAQFLLEAQGHANTRVVSPPSVLTMQHQTAVVFVGTETPTPAEVTQPFQDLLATAAPTATVLETGVTLIVRPRIAATGIVELEMLPEVAGVTYVHPTGLLLDGATPGGLVVPILQVRRAQTSVLVPDGATVLLGGLRNTLTMADTPGVPLLANLPVLGSLFRNHRQLDVRDSLIVLVTPTIVRDE